MGDGSLGDEVERSLGEAGCLTGLLLLLSGAGVVWLLRKGLLGPVLLWLFAAAGLALAVFGFAVISNQFLGTTFLEGSVLPIESHCDQPCPTAEELRSEFEQMGDPAVARAAAVPLPATVNTYPINRLIKKIDSDQVSVTLSSIRPLRDGSVLINIEYSNARESGFYISCRREGEATLSGQGAEATWCGHRAGIGVGLPPGQKYVAWYAFKDIDMRKPHELHVVKTLTAQIPAIPDFPMLNKPKVQVAEATDLFDTQSWKGSLYEVDVMPDGTLVAAVYWTPADRTNGDHTKTKQTCPDRAESLPYHVEVADGTQIAPTSGECESKNEL